MMLLQRFRERELKTVWRVTKEGRRSHLVGTAHMFPYTFRASLSKLLKDARVVLLEGPLDETSMQKVIKAGTGTTGNLLQELDEQTVAKIAATLAPQVAEVRSSIGLHMLTGIGKESAYDRVQGMKPWMAFFSIYFQFLESNGWKSSVDMEAYRLAREMRKETVSLETIDEQIQVLEGLSRTMIIDFLKRIDHWAHYMRQYARWYLDGDLAAIASNPFGFPTRDPWVIERRDKILYERMVPHLKRGDAVAFVGVPHVAGISHMMSADGYEVGRGV